MEEPKHDKMSKTLGVRKGEEHPPRISLDCDKLGLFFGSLAAAIVMAFCFFVQETEALVTVRRVGLTFVVCYAVVFVAVLIIQKVALPELERIAEERERERLREKEEAKHRRDVIPDSGKYDEVEIEPEEDAESGVRILDSYVEQNDPEE